MLPLLENRQQTINEVLTTGELNPQMKLLPPTIPTKEYQVSLEGSRIPVQLRLVCCCVDGFVMAQIMVWFVLMLEIDTVWSEEWEEGIMRERIVRERREKMGFAMEMVVSWWLCFFFFLCLCFCVWGRQRQRLSVRGLFKILWKVRTSKSTTMSSTAKRLFGTSWINNY